MTAQVQSKPGTTMTYSMPKLLLHAEGAIVFVSSMVLYAQLDLTWWWYPALLLTPDLAFVFWALGSEFGSRVYNLVHWYALPVVLGTLALLNSWNIGIGLALIWFGHIGLDRAVGYGFKYPQDFKETHLGRI